MIFSTYSFVFLFLPLVFITYSLALNSGRILLAKYVLIAASFFFYAYGSGDFFPWFVISVFFNYFVGVRLGRSQGAGQLRQKKLLLALGLLGNIALLGYYKYTDFLILNANVLFGAEIPYKNIILPIGISFFTFQLIAFLVDSYKGETKEYSLVNYLMFITFFPQLIVGPIVHHKDVVPQYAGLVKASPDTNKIAQGLFLFSLGCAKKLLMADPLTSWAQPAFDHAQDLNQVESWFASISFTLSYYFDLSGYADMAIGLGLMFGIALPINFNSPYKARNFAEYWRRWHMTLSNFLGTYIFRNVYDKSKGSRNFYWALFVTFFVSGFWHGAGWTFVVWGVVNGLFVISSHMMTRANIALPFLLAWVMTFAGVVGTRILFVANDFSDATHVLRTLFDFSMPASLQNGYVATLQPVYIIVGMALVLCFPNSNQIVARFKPNLYFMLATAVLLTASILNMSYVRGFLYFQF